MSSDKLLKYSLFSVAYLLFHGEGNSEIIYTDVDPDTIFDANGEGAYLDIDNNGQYDFTVLNLSVSFYTSFYSDFKEFEDLFAVPYISNNFIAGYAHAYYSSSLYFPYALSASEVIGPDLNWQNSPLQYLGFHLSVNNIPNMCNHCYWYGESVPETIDKFLGIKFIDTLGLNHYGWIRCDVLDLGRTLVIKDFAYESEVNKPIIAGDSNSDNDNFLSYFSYGNLLTVSINDYNMTSFNIVIYNVEGKEVVQNSINSPDYQIELSWLSSGVYIVSVYNNQYNTAFEIMVE